MALFWATLLHGHEELATSTGQANLPGQSSVRRHLKMVGYLEALFVEVLTFLQEKRRQSTGIWLLSVKYMSAQKFAKCVAKEGKGSGFLALFVGRAIGIIFLASLG